MGLFNRENSPNCSLCNSPIIGDTIYGFVHNKIYLVVCKGHYVELSLLKDINKNLTKLLNKGLINI